MRGDGTLLVGWLVRVNIIQEERSESLREESDIERSCVWGQFSSCVRFGEC